VADHETSLEAGHGMARWASPDAPEPAAATRPPGPGDAAREAPPVAGRPTVPGAPPDGGPSDRPRPLPAEDVAADDVGATVARPALSIEAAFEAFYRAAYTDVARALAYTLGDVDLAREATDEAMARAYLRWDRLAVYDSPAGWVYRVGLNWARSVHRRVARSLPFAERREVHDPPLADPALRDALAALPVDQRAVVVCRLLLDWSVERTAEALGVRPGTVKSRLHRALDALERSLGHLR
jgi:RNA polymerase sigma-70 factor (ECF subfamily)